MVGPNLLKPNARLFSETDRGNHFSLFRLTHRETFLLKAVKAVSTFEDKRQVVDIAKEIQTSIARYLVSVTLLNLGDEEQLSRALQSIVEPGDVVSTGTPAGVGVFGSR
jgi:hypothetical protein